VWAGKTAPVKASGVNRTSNIRILSVVARQDPSETIAKQILVATHLSADAPELHPARPPPSSRRGHTHSFHHMPDT
jgi:hypothetical protein